MQLSVDAVVVYCSEAHINKRTLNMVFRFI